ncbi:octopamine receptor beta-2R [Exaiptasia diaphana]|uniref:G-protein coupled receptors family 1 profile domain-containing protein n=1 Tax=Exaiptasia diaphana TaxID=2652724 RepID=A0A913XSE4_EXADI|nr:octopamine receptor beta-2R [Exaiptasia diaphana]
MSTELVDLVLTSMAMITISAIAIVSNLIIIIAVLWNKRIRSVANILFVNLAVADFFQGFIAIPLRLAEQLNQTDTKPLIPCLVVIPLTIFFYSASNLNITIISIDRFIALYRPMRYKVLVTPFVVGSVITFCWVTSLFIALIPVVTGWGAKADAHLTSICLFSTTLRKEYLFMLFSIINFAVLAILLITNVFILKTAQNHVRRIHIARAPTQETQTDNMSTINLTQTFEDAFSPRSSEKSKISFASFKKRIPSRAGRDRKATKVVLIIVGLFVVLTVPITIIDLLGVFEANVNVPLVVIKIAVFMVYFNACINVFIYAGYNQEMRDTFKIMYLKTTLYLKRH